MAISWSSGGHGYGFLSANSVRIGDFAIAHAYNMTGDTISPPAGWTEIVRENGGGYYYMAMIAHTLAPGAYSAFIPNAEEVMSVVYRTSLDGHRVIIGSSRIATVGSATFTFQAHDTAFTVAPNAWRACLGFGTVKTNLDSLNHTGLTIRNSTAVTLKDFTIRDSGGVASSWVSRSVSRNAGSLGLTVSMQLIEVPIGVQEVRVSPKPYPFGRP